MHSMGWNNLAWATVIYGALNAPVQAHVWSCRDVPYWIRSYPRVQVVQTVENLGMARWEINRLLKCLSRG